MKFLPREREYDDIILLNMIYNRGTGYGKDDLTIVYKDLASGQKRVEILERPMIEVWIVKPEFRNYDYVRNFMETSKCYPLTVHYATRFHEIAKELNLPSAEDAKQCPYVFGADTTIEHYYMKQFEYEYHTDKPKNLSLGYFDIENDTINIDTFPEYGETPINCVTYIDDESQECYTLILAKSNIKLPAASYPKYPELKDLDENYKEKVSWLKDHIPDFVQMCHEMFDEYYGEMNYNILLFDDEIKLIQSFWKIIHATDNDFVLAWNLPYDMQNMMMRPMRLDEDVNEIIPDPRLGDGRKVYFYEDKNPVVHKKRHRCISYTIPSFVDQMVFYAGIRSGRGKLPSHKLNFVAQRELGDTKLDYSESGDIHRFPYQDPVKFWLYNIKDTLLLVGIERKTKDMDTIYSRMYSSMILPEDSFTTTKMVLGALDSFVFKEESPVVLGANKNKFAQNRNAKQIDYNQLLSQYWDADDNVDINLEPDEDEEEDDEEREKYDGAFVMNTLHMNPTGYELLGKPSKWIHRYVGDEDITSEYPSAIIVWNISNETLIGRVFLDDPEQYKIPVYNSFHFRGNDLDNYKLDVSNFMLECYSERDVLNFGSIFLNLPSVSEVLDEFDHDIEKYLK